ncbi:MAG: hypothetical protein DMG00_24805 [Acidobacteria bacterium]|nr:MAG: hypothetical protein DMG00_24805 [Acidobacteriota bacterium]
MVGRPLRLLRVLGFVSVALLVPTGISHAQGGTTATLSGIVVDVSGGVVPGADVVAKQVATGVTTAAVSNAEGVFSFPALNVGTYTVTVTLQGFKTFVADGVVLTSGTGASVRARAAARSGRGIDQRGVVVGDRADAERNDYDDHRYEPDHEASAHEPERDGFRADAAGRRDGRRQPQLHD